MSAQHGAPNGASVEGKAVVVTGGTTGIGRATARRLAAQGARVFLFGRHRAELDEALEELRADGGDVYGTTADVAEIADIRSVFQAVDAHFGGLDILVNNAAVNSADFDEGELEQAEYVVRANLFGYIACAREAVRRMRGRSGGHIVNIGSMSADLREEGNSIYVATKAGIQAFSESLRKSVNPDGIRVTLIEPGKVATDLVDASDVDKREQVQAQAMLRPEDVADCVYYCLGQPERCDVVAVQLRPLGQII